MCTHARAQAVFDPSDFVLPIECDGCRQVWFCSEACAQHARTAAPGVSHSVRACQRLAKLADVPWLHAVSATSFRFVVQALELRDGNAELFGWLDRLEPSDSHPTIKPAVAWGTVDAADLDLLRTLYCLLPADAALSFEAFMVFAAKESRNAFALMAPKDWLDDDGDRQCRAQAIYPSASLLNHSCVPNAVRFDDGDRQNAAEPTVMTFRALTDLQIGAEVFISYFALNTDVQERTTRLHNDYGFSCGCSRCALEAGDSACKNSHRHDEDHFDESAFLKRVVCSSAGCGGTLCPLPPGVTEPTQVE